MKISFIIFIISFSLISCVNNSKKIENINNVWIRENINDEKIIIEDDVKEESIKKEINADEEIKFTKEDEQMIIDLLNSL